MKNNTKKKRRLRKSVRETLTALLIGATGALLFVSVWIGSVLQTMEAIG